MSRSSLRFDPVFALGTGGQVRGLINLMSDIQSINPSKQSWVEIGTHLGESALIMSSFNFMETLNCVDPSIAECREVLEKRLSNGIRIKQIHLHSIKSEEYAEKIADYSIDGIYIDGCHKLECVRTDLSIWHNKVKKDGFICGHDHSDSWPEVRQAIDEFCEQHNYKIKKYVDSSWMILR
jgi:hypothetical protein